MKIYIASSWKNQHAVEMLTDLLRKDGHTVVSFVENSRGEGYGPGKQKFDLVYWIKSVEGKRCFHYDTEGATRSDLVIYIGPSGIDAWAEIGAAWASNIPIYGLWAKGEQIGLMRRMILAENWFYNYKDLLSSLKSSLRVRVDKAGMSL